MVPAGTMWNTLQIHLQQINSMKKGQSCTVSRCTCILSVLCRYHRHFYSNWQQTLSPVSRKCFLTLTESLTHWFGDSSAWMSRSLFWKWRWKMSKTQRFSERHVKKSTPEIQRFCLALTTFYALLNLWPLVNSLNAKLNYKGPHWLFKV